MWRSSSRRRSGSRLLGSESATDADRRRWDVWLSACPEHRAAWARVEAVTRKFDRLPARAASAALGVVHLGRRGALKTLALLGGVGIAGFGARRAVPWREWIALHQTGVGSTREVTLPDGTRVWLNTASALDVAFDADLRRIQLHAGEALIETASDRAVPSRPFVVDSAEGRVVRSVRAFACAGRRWTAASPCTKGRSRSNPRRRVPRAVP